MKRMSAYVFGVAAFIATLVGTRLDALTMNDLTPFDRDILCDYESKGRFAFMWFDCDGNNHISTINGGVNIRSALPGWYMGTTLDGGRICLFKDGCGCYYLNGIRVVARYLDCKSWHTYFVPVCG